MTFSGETKCLDGSCPIESESMTPIESDSNTASSVTWQDSDKMSPGMWFLVGLGMTTMLVGWYCFGLDWYEVVSSRY